MPSRAELRVAGERLLRVALVALLAVALWRSLREREGGTERRGARAGTLATALRDATRDPRIAGIDLAVDSLPTPVQRSWLAALRRAGGEVRWRGAAPSLAIGTERAREPSGPVRVLVAAEPGSPLALSDSAGALDSLRPRAGGASLEASDVVGAVRARRGAMTASAAVPPAAQLRAVLVLGRASWESRFVSAALGEAGWRVRARVPAAPGVIISDPALLPIDTARYDVIVVLDSTAADLAPEIARFVRSGGGLVVAGNSSSLGALRPLVPARSAERRPGRILLEADSVTRADLPVRPLVGLRDDAVPIERLSSGLTVAVRRAGNGRVLAVGYDESWRWRMLGGASGASAHRTWWSRTVGLVAPERDAGTVRGSDAAPTAALVEALGPATAASALAPEAARDALPLALLVAVALALLAETASRRFRGAR